MKKFIAHILVIMLPYICVMLGWLFSFGAFNYQVTVTSDGFYVACTIYWLMIQWVVHFTVDEIIDGF